ncbi:MAG TPA: MFS transporter [Gemmatimonadaceae bacterium]|nr:MFS transporter [Gemmatimonadaceae bacterium]
MVDDVVASPRGSVARAPRVALAILTLINLLNYLDRYVVAAVAEALKRSPLHPSDAQIGLLQSGFIVVYMLVAPVFGALGDTRSRTRLIGWGIALWSVATALGGLAWSYLSLLGARALVGIGEAAYATIAPALLADLFPLRLRARAFAIFFAATPVGAALGYVLGGTVGAQFGWRAAFLVAGVPGLVLAVFAFLLHDPPRGAHDGAGVDATRPSGAAHATPTLGAASDVHARPRGWRAYTSLLRNRRYVVTVLGYAAYTFALGGIAWWMPAFLERVRGLSPIVATRNFGLMVVVTGFAGTFAGGWVADYFLRYSRQSYLWVAGLTTLAAVPLTVVAFSAAAPSAFWLSLTVAELLLFASTGPINSVVVDVVSPTMRASAMALNILAIHVLGDVPSPYLIGLISDRSSLQHAVMIIPIALLVGGVIWTVAAWSGPGARGSALAPVRGA